MQGIKMAKMNHVRCVLAVNDLKKSTEYFTDKPGFNLDLENEGWSFLTRDNFSLMLGHCPAHATAPASE